MQLALFALQIGQQFGDAIQCLLVEDFCGKPRVVRNPTIELDALFTHGRRCPWVPRTPAP